MKKPPVLGNLAIYKNFQNLEKEILINLINYAILQYMRFFSIFLFICCVSIFSCKTLPEQTADVSLKNCESLSDSVSEPVQAAYEILIQGNNLKTGLSSIIRTQKDLDKLYSILYGNSLKAPVIDFSKKAVVTVAAGPFNTGGYSVLPLSAIKTGKTVNMVFEIKSPGPKEMVTQAFTHPYVIVSVEAAPDTEIFIEIKGNSKSGYDKLDF